MVTAVCLNPAIDFMLEVQDFKPGELNRVLASRRDAAGKGVNVAIACSQLGLSACCTGFLSREGAEVIEQKLLMHHVQACFIENSGAVRINTKISDRKDGSYTEVNQPGEAVSTQQVEALIERLPHLQGGLFVLSGSIPPGCPQDIYRSLIQTAAASGKRCILDAEKQPLALGLLARPFMVKPNRFELETLAGKSLQTRQDILRAALQLTEGGVTWVVVSLGGEGALATDGKQALYAPALPVQARGLAGAGDCLVAGICSAIEQGLPLEEALRCGMAGGTASVVTEGTLLIDPEAYERFLPQIKIEAMPL